MVKFIPFNNRPWEEGKLKSFCSALKCSDVVMPHRSSKGNKLSEAANFCRLSFSESLSLFRDKLAFHSSRK